MKKISPSSEHVGGTPFPTSDEKREASSGAETESFPVVQGLRDYHELPLAVKNAAKALLPDPLFVSLLHKKRIGRWPRLRCPVTFNEQILQRSLHPDPRYGPLADKIAVRAYVEETIGREYVVPVLAAPVSFTRAVFDRLPASFVMKANHGSNYIKVVRDKADTTFEELQQLASRWLSSGFYWVNREKLYRSIEPRLLFEPLLLDRSGRIPADYKIHCFGGRLGKKVMYILVISDRFGSDTRGDVYDANWTWTDIAIGEYQRSDAPISPPDNLDAALYAAEKLSDNFDYVRVDLYAFDGQLYFGELTFTPGGGVLPFTPDRVDYEWGDLLRLARGGVS